MYTPSPNSIHLFINGTKVLPVYKRINFRNASCTDQLCAGFKVYSIQDM